MANPEHLKILKQGVEVWNQWRESHPDEDIDLSEANLRKTDLSGANLRGAKLSRGDLHEADLREAILSMADLHKADLSKADLSKADLSKADLGVATLFKTNLSEAKITGAILRGTARDDWVIDGIKCDYVFWDFKNKQRAPSEGKFHPGEFEELYKSLPTFEYVFEQGFTALDAVVMGRIVQAINEKHPEFELKLDSFHSRGEPHAKFTVLHKEHVEAAKSQVTTNFEQRLAALEGKQEQMMELFARIADNPKTIELIMGDKRMIQAGRDYVEQVAGDVTTGEGTNEPKEGNSEGSPTDVAPSESKTSERSDLS